MSNTLKGRIGVEVEGEQYTLLLDINALCALEDELGVSAAGLADMLQAGLTLNQLRAVLWCALLEHHPAITLKQAGVLIGDLGGVKAATALVVRAVSAAWPSPAAPVSGEEAAPVNPRRRKARAGTG